MNAPNKKVSAPHDSAHTHVCGESIFVDDRPMQKGELLVGLLYSEIPKGELRSIDVSEALQIEGIHGIYTHEDLTHNIWGPIIADQPILVEKEISYVGEVIAVIAAEHHEAIEAAKKSIKIDVVEHPPIFSIDEAIECESFISVPRTIQRGCVNEALANAPHTLSGVFSCNGQDHFYLESQAAIAYPKERGQIELHSSSQHPTEGQHLVAEALGLGFHQVVCIVKRMGGGFGGKESQAAPFGVFAALVAHKTGRAARCTITKDDDMIMTGNRHPFQNHWTVGFDDDGHILALDVQLYSNGGAFADLSTSVMERAMMHSDNAYFIPNIKIVGRVCRTNIHPNTAFRGFGGPQGIGTIESLIEEMSQQLNIDAWDIRALNCYGVEDRNTAPYGQLVENNTLPELFERLYQKCNYAQRRQEIDAYNAQSLIDYRGLSVVPVKFGISFTARFLNQGNALVNVHTDGTVQVATGGTEMGQGLNAKIRDVAASCFGIPANDVIVTATSTEKNHNTSPTAASSGSDINCAAAEQACLKIVDRLKNIAVQVFERQAPLTPSEEFCLDETLDTSSILLKNEWVFNAKNTNQRIAFAELVRTCFFNRISLGEYGYHKTEGIYFDVEKGFGHPFLYYTNGICCSEVSIDRYTGELKVLQSDIIMDLGRTINEGIDYGQVCGAFVQGMGWVTTENLFYSAQGKLLSHSPTTYKIPSIQDVPRHFSMELLENDGNEVNVRRSKAVGEPPFVLGMSAWTAAKNALSYCKTAQLSEFSLPASNEENLRRLNEDL